LTATKTILPNRLDLSNTRVTVFHHPQMEPSCCRETLIKINCSQFYGLTNAGQVPLLTYCVVHVYTW
jgi:hypothetical protein